MFGVPDPLVNLNERRLLAAHSYARSKPFQASLPVIPIALGKVVSEFTQ